MLCAVLERYLSGVKAAAVVSYVSPEKGDKSREVYQTGGGSVPFPTGRKPAFHPHQAHSLTSSG